MEDNVKEIKMVENGLIIILLFVIIVILLPSVATIISKSLSLSAKTSTSGTIEIVKELYINLNIEGDIALPFKVEYNKEGYVLYSNNKRYTPKKNIKVKSKGKLPTGGSIEIKKDGLIIIENLKFGICKCNQDESQELVCKI